MSFRRDKERFLKWEKWVQKHRDELIACGVPHIVLEDLWYWYYFLDHGYYTPAGSAEPIIDVDRMSKTNAERLCLVLEQDDFYPGCDTLNRLQHLLKRGRHAEASV